jgi:CheY-like chemotaxis protein
MKLIQAREIAEEASKAKADFLSNMSHELRTPLNGIIGSVHIMLMEKHLEEQQQNFNNLKNLSEHMMGLVNDILDFSKIESGKLELNVHQVNLGELTEKIHGYFHNPFHKKNLYYKINIDDQLKSTWVSTDELRLQQILGNLVNNALKFTHKGGVALNVKMLERDETTVKVRFAVKDTGIGIAAEKLQSIFEGFNQADNATTRKYGGTGLGLSISGSLAKLFNSEIKVASKQGSGSEFSFEISFPLQRKAEPVYNNRQNVLSLKDKKVLLAEDNPINMKVAKRMLQGWGLQVEEAGNGKIAVDKCSLQKFDILLIDLSMPEMDGKAAISAINKMPNRAPSLAFTAALYENMRDDLISHGFSDYVMKPFKPEELFDKIQEAIAN